MMTIREATALVMLYRTCLIHGDVVCRNAARMAVAYVPELTEYNVFEKLLHVTPAETFPFKLHRTQAQVIHDDE